jgi:hypothetical protein
MKDISFLKRYETIYGVLIGAIPSLLFQIFPPETTIPFSWFLSIITLLLIATWFCFASRAHVINDLNEIRVKMESLTEYQDIELSVTHLNWDKQKMKFKCNSATNLLSKGQCLTIYYKKDDYNYLCGIARIMEYDVNGKTAQANVVPLVKEELNDEPHLSKENVILSPILDYDILEIFIKKHTEENDE